MIYFWSYCYRLIHKKQKIIFVWPIYMYIEWYRGFTMMVLLLPPRAFWRSLVRTESRYGTTNTAQIQHNRTAISNCDYSLNLKHYSLHNLNFTICSSHQYFSIDFNSDIKGLKTKIKKHLNLNILTLLELKKF